MTVNPLPPQAYTKETLQKAYSWLLHQNASVKDLASSQDMLVSLYLKAQRNGEASLEAPSIQNFKQELKNLASMIGDLQTPNSSAAAKTVSAPTSASSSQTTYVAPAAPQAIPPASEPVMPKSPPVTGLPKHTIEETPVTAANGFSGNSSPANLLATLDPQTLLTLSEVRESLNLSSEMEALRALIAIGYKQFKKI